MKRTLFISLFLTLLVAIAAQEMKPTCNKCSATYIPKSEIDAYLQRVPAALMVSDQQVRALNIGKSNVDIGVVYRGKLTGESPVAEHDQVSEVYHILDGSATLVTGSDIVDPKRRPADNDAVKMLKAADPSKYKPAPGADYPKGRFGDSLRQLAQLIKANLGVQVAFADIGGWDHHVNEGSTEGQIANVLREFSQSLSAFWTDLGDLGEDTVVVTMSEFGRTARENGNRGTDHGHANVMFVLGGPVKGGKVYGRWPGLDQSQLYEGRDLAVTTDFRQVLGESVARHMGNKNLNEVFPGYGNSPGKFLGILG